MNNTDVLIIGGGLAGLNAAAEIRENHPKMSVTVVDAGGCASTEIMGFSAPANPPDSPEIFYQDIVRSAQDAGDDALARILATRALPEMHRLERMGLAFTRQPDGQYDMVNAVGTTYPRVVHHATTTGRDAIALLKVSKCRARITQLVLSRSHAIAGAVTANGEFIRAKAVILATGGFAGLWRTSTWSKKLRGDGLLMALELGAETTGMQYIQFEPMVAVHPEKLAGTPIISTVLNEGGRLLDNHGQSLIPPDEKIPRKRELARRIQYCIDSGCGDEHGGVIYDFSEVDDSLFKRKYPEYMARYLPDGGSLNQLRVSVKPAAHTTLGGLKITPGCSTSIPGLFAAGEVAGGIHGKDRLGGNAGLEVFVFGRIAGQSAAAYALSSDFKIPVMPPPLPQTSPEQFAQIGRLLDKYVTVNGATPAILPLLPACRHSLIVKALFP